MEYNIINISSDKEVVGSTYADLYIDYDDNKLKGNNNKSENRISATFHNDNKDSWKSPSDLLIGLVELKPPLTSKIIKSKTHEGILEIGDDLLKTEHQEFLISLRKLLDENDDCWTFILKNAEEEIYEKVKTKYEKNFKEKRTVMTEEITKFYENSLKELEVHIKSEVQNVLIGVHASMISTLNNQIHSKLQKEKLKLNQNLKNRYENEVKKVEKYYDFLLNHEFERVDKLVKRAISERNHAISIFYEQILHERITSTMYIMCTERRKCKVKKNLIENFQNQEIIEIVEKIKEKREILRSFKDKGAKISELNEDWEEKNKKVLLMFSKFISFALKLLPEQTAFLLEFKKMVQLQLEELKDSDMSKSSILLEESNLLNFHHLDSSDSSCDNEPFIIEGDLSDTPIRVYGSRESLPADVELPLITLQRQFVYAKCHGFEGIKKYLESEKCQCRTPLNKESSISILIANPDTIKTSTSKSSDELYVFEDVHRLIDCPVRRCTNMLRKFSFPYLNSYLDYSQENFKRVEAILGASPKNQTKSIPLDIMDITCSDLPFSETKEKYHSVGTQYSSEEDIRLDNSCLCIQNLIKKNYNNANKVSPLSTAEIWIKRKKMLNEICNKYPKLMKILVDHGVPVTF